MATIKNRGHRPYKCLTQKREYGKQHSIDGPWGKLLYQPFQDRATEPADFDKRRGRIRKKIQTQAETDSQILRELCSWIETVPIRQVYF